jgi:ATP-dependent Clp protease ATP-binding subunit ClpA
VIGFKGLTPEILSHVVDKFVSELAAQLADRRVHVEVDQAARAWLAEKGYDPLYGARPLARVIQEHIKRPLADELLFGQLVKGGKVVVTIREGKLAFDITEARITALLPPPGSDPDLLIDDDEADDPEDEEFLPEPAM